MQNSPSKLPIIVITLLSLTLIQVLPAFAKVRTEHTSLNLVCEVTSVEEGTNFSVAIVLEPDPGWHVYWINPGDNGSELKVRWDMPEDFEAGDLQFPTPGFVPFQTMMSYGYDGRTFYIAEIQPPSEFSDEITLKASARWLACDDSVCVPERGDISITLPKGDSTEFSSWRTEFENTRSHHPVNTNWASTFTTDDENVIIEVAVPEAVEGLNEAWMFPAVKKLINHAEVQTISSGEGVIQIKVKPGTRHERYDEIVGLLKLSHSEDSQGTAYQFTSTRVEDLGSKEFTDTHTHSASEQAAGHQH